MRLRGACRKAWGFESPPEQFFFYPQNLPDPLACLPVALKCQLRDFGSTQTPLISLPDQKLRWKQNGKTVTGRSKNLDEIFSIKREKNIRPSQSSDQNWSILAGWKHQGSINRDNIIDKRNAGTQTNPCRGGFKRKFGEIFLNLITNPWTGGELPALFCGYIKNGP